jgi:S1-C subfamily serine protease
VTSLGIDSSLNDLNLPVRRGALVQTVAPGSPAARAGIKGGDIVAQLDGNTIRLGGDIITAVDGKRISSADDLANAVAGKRKGDKVKIDVVRGGDKRTIEVTLGARPPSQANGSG